MESNKVLTEELKEKYLSELKRNPEKDFGLEFVRITDLETTIIRDHGFQGLQLILSNSHSDEIYQLGRIPSDCVWEDLNSCTLNEAIDSVFSSIKNKVPNLIISMKERVRFIYATKSNSTWELNYFLDMKLYDGREYFVIYTGGMPSSVPQENDSLLKFGWTIPEVLKEFYSIHNGFGAKGDSKAILSSHHISVMGELMNSIAEEQNETPEGYKFNDLLEFFPDGCGNAQCFLKEDVTGACTVDWDHETWEISEKENFYDFIDSRMSELDEE